MSTEVLSPTTGEPVEVVARRNRLGLWLLIISDAAGTVSLLISYAYLWSLNVNNAWAPTPGSANWASDMPFWGIWVLMVLGTLLVWWGAKGVAAGHRGRLVTGAALGGLIMLIAFVAQILQLSTFPFATSDGAYASATFWLALSNCIHLSLAGLLVIAVMNRTRKGLITEASPSHARFVAMWLTWLCVAAFLGALFTTVMQESPNTSPTTFGTFAE